MHSKCRDRYLCCPWLPLTDQHPPSLRPADWPPWRAASPKLVRAHGRRHPVCEWTCFVPGRTLHGLTGCRAADVLIGPNDCYRQQMAGHGQCESAR